MLIFIPIVLSLDSLGQVYRHQSARTLGQYRHEIDLPILAASSKHCCLILNDYLRVIDFKEADRNANFKCNTISVVYRQETRQHTAPNQIADFKLKFSLFFIFTICKRIDPFRTNFWNQWIRA